MVLKLIKCDTKIILPLSFILLVEWCIVAFICPVRPVPLGNSLRPDTQTSLQTRVPEKPVFDTGLDALP